GLPRPALGPNGEATAVSNQPQREQGRRSASRSHCGWRQLTGAVKASPAGGPDGPALTAPPPTRLRPPAPRFHPRRRPCPPPPPPGCAPPPRGSTHAAALPPRSPAAPKKSAFDFVEDC